MEKRRIQQGRGGIYGKVGIVTGRTKSDALLRDVAKLFVTYSPRDWEPLLAELNQGSELQKRVANLIAELANAAPTPRRSKPGKSKAAERQSAARMWAHPERAEALKSLEVGLRGGRLLPTFSAVKEALARTGLKSPVPRTRAAAIAMLLEGLDQMPGEKYLALADAIIKSDPVQSTDRKLDYQRWFALILDKPANPGAASDLHLEVLNLMDKALIRGPRYFNQKDEADLRACKERWIRAGGTARGTALIDEFLKTVMIARGARESDDTRLGDRVTAIKNDWRHLKPR